MAPQYLERDDYLGTWLVSAFDIDRTIRTVSRRTWDGLVDFSSPDGESDDSGKIHIDIYAPELVTFLRGVIFSQPPTPPLPAKSKGTPYEVATGEERDSKEEDEEGKRGRLLTAAVDSLTWMIRSCAGFACFVDFGLMRKTKRSLLHTGNLQPPLNRSPPSQAFGQCCRLLPIRRISRLRPSAEQCGLC
jgi:hypothetical protein